VYGVQHYPPISSIDPNTGKADIDTAYSVRRKSNGGLNRFRGNPSAMR
jgi:hypothetical protein